MTIEDLIVHGKQYLHTNQVRMLLGHVLNCDTLELYNHLNEQVKPEDITNYKNMIQKINSGEPIQYVLGNVNFYGYSFIVNKNVLIPRFETEELVEQTLALIEQYFPNQPIKIIDLGSGSGNIGITLKKKKPYLDVTCVDISDEALLVAMENAKQLNAEITFKKSNMLDQIDTKYDVIISNPPYIGRNEEIETIVAEHEPHLALYAENDGIYYYDKILKTCSNHLNDRFLIAFEIGMTQKDTIIKLAKQYLGDVRINCRKDLSDKDRMIFISNIK